jgi:hypothetical protein
MSRALVEQSRAGMTAERTDNCESRHCSDGCSVLYLVSAVMGKGAVTGFLKRTVAQEAV